ncbi:hypothetical protein SAMN05443247_06543 [Bradyrhizobium erythrophlei]|nr:hypothetical protein SAMN05443247_06543 [Bradyrhizobium erythrophlei]
MSFNGHDIPWWIVFAVAVGLITILIVAYHA